MAGPWSANGRTRADAAAGLVEQADADVPGAIPERRGHPVEVAGQAGGARQHQQEGRGGGHGLAGVEQCPPHALIQRMRLVEEDDQRSVGATQGQQLGKRARVAAQLPAEPSNADGGRQGVREQRPEPGRRHQRRRERIDTRQVARGAPYDVDLPGGLDLAPEPAQQHRLAVAPGPDSVMSRDVPRPAWT